MVKSAYKFIISFLGSIFLVLATSAIAQDNLPVSTALTNETIITTNSDATLSVSPDQAQLEVGVVTQAPAANDAGTKNRNQSNAVLDALRKLLGPQADIKTTGYSLNPDYHYPKEGGKPTIVSYTATNTVQIKINRLDLVSNAIDVAMKAGANTISSLQFTLGDEQNARLQVLHMAALKAKARADALAATFGLKVGQIISISQDQSEIQPFVMALARTPSIETTPPTPIVAGAVQIRATVTLKVQAILQEKTPTPTPPPLPSPAT